IWLREPRLDIRGAVRGLDLARAFCPRDSVAAVGGTASADFEASGPLSDPGVTAAIEVLAPRARGFAADTLEVRLRYEPGLLLLEEARLAAGGGRIEAVGRAEPELRLEDWVRNAASGDSVWARAVPLDVSLQAAGFDLRRLAPLAPSLGTLEGTAVGRAHVTGTAADPRVDLSASGSGLAFRGITVDQGALQGRYENERITIQDLTLKRGGALSTIRGYVPFDLSLGGRRRGVAEDSMRLEVRMTEADFGIAALLVPQIAASSGKLTLSADLAGTPAHPDVIGSLKLREGTVRFSGRDEVLEGIELDGTLSEDGITATRIAAREGRRGVLKGSGTWRYVSGTPLGQYEIRIHAQDFTATDRLTYLLRFTGDFLIRNGESVTGVPMPLITGSAALSRGELTWTQEPAGAEERGPTPFLYEVTLEAPRNLWFRNLDTEVELATSGRLIVKNEGEGDYLLGALDVLRGRYYVCYSKFRIVSGTISFRTVDKIDPEVTLDAETQVPSPNQPEPEVIKMALSGPSSQLKVTLYDGDASPALLWKKLCIGQVSSLGSEQNAEGGTASGGGSPDVTLPIRDYLFRNVERWLGDVGIIDTIDLKSGEVTTRTAGVGAPAISSVGVGKYVTPELYLRYSRDFSGSAERTISAEYRVTRYLLLKGEQVKGRLQENPAGTEYNLDLKLRIEY
ncbi:MAG TPA: translocation/assembly module TamB domain-containing protein, partial [Candidatus Eisenbacteria bacterium]